MAETIVDRRIDARSAVTAAGVGLLRGVQRALLSRLAILPSSGYIPFITGSDPSGVGG